MAVLSWWSDLSGRLKFAEYFYRYSELARDREVINEDTLLLCSLV